MNSSRKRPGLLFTLVGPAGAGKNRLMNHVIALTPLRQFPTATTRPIRPGEQQGREHLYVSVEEFERMIAHDELLEHQVIHGNFYGMPRVTIDEALDSGQSLIADIEFLGAERARRAYPDNVISIFVQAPSLGVLIDRMHERGEKNREISKRLLRVPMELEYAPNCDYAIFNDSFDHAANLLYEIVTTELRGEHRTVKGDSLCPYHFTYETQVIPVYNNQALRRDHSIRFSSTDLPHLIVLNVLQDELHISPNKDALIGGGPLEGKFMPPVMLNYAQDEHGEHFTYIYLYRLDKPMDAPTGWSWTPIDTLPNDLQTALPESQNEA